ncbi:excisionase [Methylobacterium sp. WL12]|uniref:excisionase n=1 Tax=Methylobacterium sp. WL12 TaxID=2603890 RepID=UPI0011CB76E4|nr:excisionase [Methylobacterium sp. WL12]TXM66899.1 excisionase [Methylobacterium sp. WL12]
MPTITEILERARAGKNVKVPPLAEAVGLSVNGFYAAVRRGDIEAIRVGRAVMVPGREALRLLSAEQRPAA